MVAPIFLRQPTASAAAAVPAVVRAEPILANRAAALAAEAAAQAAARAKRAADLVRRPFHTEHGVPKLQADFNEACKEKIKTTGTIRLGKTGMTHHPAMGVGNVFADVGVGRFFDTYLPLYFPGLPAPPCVNKACNGNCKSERWTRARRAHAFHIDVWFAGRRCRCTSCGAAFDSYDHRSVSRYESNVAHAGWRQCYRSPSSTTTMPG
jgi:hypothetical protein